MRRYKRIAQSENSAAAQEEGGLLEDNDGSDEEEDGPRESRQGYGAIEAGSSPRVEPSHLGEDRNHWQS